MLGTLLTVLETGKVFWTGATLKRPAQLFEQFAIFLRQGHVHAVLRWS